MNLKINIDRLRADLEDLGRIGRDPNGGVTRPSFSRADLEARAWFKQRIEDAGLTYRLEAPETSSAGRTAPERRSWSARISTPSSTPGCSTARSECSPAWSACGRSRKAVPVAPCAGPPGEIGNSFRGIRHPNPAGRNGPVWSPTVYAYRPASFPWPASSAFSSASGSSRSSAVPRSLSRGPPPRSCR